MKTRVPRKRRTARDTVRGRVRAHDPFELIRWLALSQPDPRKALAELVQNSLDAGAHTIRVTRVRERGAPSLRIWDDGLGVIPELDRRAALHYLATHIGHSRKRSLSPKERLQLMTQGQYGIGLLGFWSLGQQLEMRTAVPAHVAHRLVLHRDRPDFLIEPLRGRLAIEDRWTEVVVSGLHPEAQGVLLGRRAADYLASELRGQLLAREVRLVVDDRMARGRAPKLIEVRPPRFLGDRIDGLGPLEISGLPPVRLEIYVAAGDVADGERAPIAVYAAGTLVAESFEHLSALDLDRQPWTDVRLTGLVDFPGLHVAPGSRRGVLVDDAASAFERALRAVEPVLAAALESLDRRRAEQLDQTLIRDLQRAFRDFARHRPRWALLPVARARDVAATADPEATNSSAAADGVGDAGTARGYTAGQPDDVAGPPVARPRDLLPTGPLAAVRIAPDPVRVVLGGQRRIAARAVDATGRAVEEPVRYDWTLAGPIGELVADVAHGPSTTLVAGPWTAEGRVEVVATSDGNSAQAEAAVEVIEEAGSARGAEGIPEPELIDQPGAPWRSRVVEERWQVNTAHRDYRSVADRAALKLRYLALLFAKELVLRNSQDPRLDSPLEQMVEAFTYADRRLSRR